MIEILIVGVIMIFVFTYVGAFNFGKFVDDNNHFAEYNYIKLTYYTP